MRKLKLNGDKCEVGYIGHVLSKDGLKPDLDKVQAIQEMSEPKDKAALQRCMVQYLTQFIPNLSTTTQNSKD